MEKFLQEPSLPDQHYQDLVRKHEEDVEHLLRSVAAVFGICVVLFAAWDFVVQPRTAPVALAIRSVAVLLAALIYLRAAQRYSPLLRAGYMFGLYASAVVLAGVSADNPSSVAGVTALLGTLTLINVQIRTFLYMAATPTCVFAICAVARLPVLEAVNAMVMYLVGLVVALLTMIAARNFRIRAVILQQELVRISRHDSLTGVFNRRYVTELALRELERARRHARPLAVAMMDLDHFKAINDTHGHDVGDRVLQEVARVCLANVRTTDFFGRFGGEEFIVVMPDADVEDALECAERLRERVAHSAVAGADGEVACTISIGVAVLPPGSTMDWQGLLKQADVALYQAKDHGRNRVVLA